MNDQVNLAYLAAQIEQLQQQMEQVNRRLDMIYGAINRMAEGQQSRALPASTQEPAFAQENSQRPLADDSGTPLSARMMMDPGSMLASLYQYAQNIGLNVSPESELPEGKPDEAK
jgi:hypothetical protein